MMKQIGSQPRFPSQFLRFLMIAREKRKNGPPPADSVNGRVRRVIAKLPAEKICQH
jgi:hypothetical protein